MGRQLTQQPSTVEDDYLIQQTRYPRQIMSGEQGGTTPGAHVIDEAIQDVSSALIEPGVWLIQLFILFTSGLLTSGFSMLKISEN